MSKRHPPQPADNVTVPERPSRRSFAAAALSLLTGGLALVTPLGVGVAAFLSPLFRRNSTPEVRVALLDQVPDDGKPRCFPVVADREDAWTRYPAQRIGAVYLVRQPGAEKPIAFTARCPHAGCFIGFSESDNLFKCPCHTSSFKLDGGRVHGDAEVAPRDMDQLAVDLRPIVGPEGAKAAEIWIKFVEFQTGTKQRMAAS